jgi:hypothetical protein
MGALAATVAVLNRIAFRFSVLEFWILSFENGFKYLGS